MSSSIAACEGLWISMNVDKMPSGVSIYRGLWICVEAEMLAVGGDKGLI